MTTIIHIGPHKTGTSWFQKHVYPNVAGYRYVPRERARRAFLAPDAFGFDPVEARRLAGDLSDAIVCEEDLSGVMHNANASNLIAAEVARRLYATVPDAQIVIFAREQGAAAYSRYLQYLREGGTGSLHRYLFPEGWRHLGHDRPYKVPRFAWDTLNVAGLVAHYDSLFGADRVHVFLHEQLVREPEAVMAGLERILGAELPRPNRARANSGYRRPLIPLLRFANLFTKRSVAYKTTLLHIPYWYTVRKAMFERLNRLSWCGKPVRAHDMIDRQTRQFIAERFARSNRWLAERTGVDLEAYGYAVAEPARPVAAPRRTPVLAWMSN